MASNHLAQGERNRRPVAPCSGIDSGRLLAANAELFDNCLVARFVLALDIIKERPALRHHLLKAATRMIVLRMGFEMVRKIGDTFRQNGDLDFRRPCIAFAGCELLDEVLLAFWRNRHRITLSN